MDTKEVVNELQARLDPANRKPASSNLDLLSVLSVFDVIPRIPRVHCTDGFSMSVQAQHTAYCSPRDSKGPWYEVEVGFPSERVEDFMPYIDDEYEPDSTEAVYGFVPINIVADVIIAHGGFKGYNHQPIRRFR
jgi:hypothetical protein